MAKELKSTVDRPFFFFFPSLDQTNVIFRKLMKGEDFLILVIGEQGSGKTTFLERYIAASSAGWIPCRITMDSFQSKQLEHQSRHLMTGESDAYLAKKNGSKVLMIDDAQLLGLDAVLHLLCLDRSAREGDSKDRMDKIVLFCEPNLLEYLPQVKRLLPAQSSIKKIYLPTLTENQTNDFLTQWIQKAFDGHGGPVILERRQRKTIYRLSAGKPGQILEEAKQILMKNQQSSIRAFFAALVAGWRQRRRHGEIVIF